MKSIFYITVLVLNIHISTFCQTKIYSGKFDGITHRNSPAKEEGVATYQYYENSTYDRTFHGSFSFTGKTINLNGTFKDGKKIGYWRINSDNTEDNMIGPDGFFCMVKFNTNIFGNFKEGRFNGEWVYNYNNSISCGNKTPPKWEKHIDIKSIAHFSDGIYNGKIIHERTSAGTYEIEEGQFDENGFFDGVWTKKRKSIKTIKKYNHGIYYFILEQNITTGEKLKYIDNTDWLNKILANYDKTNGTSIIDSVCYSMDTIKGWHYLIWEDDQLLLENYVNSDTNPLYNLGGSEKPKCYEIRVNECIQKTGKSSTPHNQMQQNNSRIVE